MVNLANLYFIEERFDEALVLLARADELLPDNPSIKLSLARVYYDTGNYARVKSLYAEAQKIDAGMAARYVYLAGSSSEDAESRAAVSDLARSLPLWVEEE